MLYCGASRFSLSFLKDRHLPKSSIVLNLGLGVLGKRLSSMDSSNTRSISPIIERKRNYKALSKLLEARHSSSQPSEATLVESGDSGVAKSEEEDSIELGLIF